jgi:hypothetical protein
MVTTTRRCVCVLALVLLVLAVGVGSVASREARVQESLPLLPLLFDYGLTVQTMGGPAWAETLAGVNQERMEACGCYEGVFTTRARFKTH